jgi:hypothetical protein
MAYFSNGSEGMVFDEQCSICKYGDKPCPIASIQYEFNYSQNGNYIAEQIMDKLVNDDGECSMFKAFKIDFEIDPTCKQEILDL